ncbi:MAG: hypothetical protein P9M08_11750 [Candidatus Erginobacter occultus]|nr:hypothetical protein [Candidatus Erginobacter occultus]
MGLQPREKRTVIVGGCLLFLMAVLYLFFVSEDSLYQRWTELQSDVAGRQEVLSKMVRAQVAYRNLTREVGRVTVRLAGAGREATLKGYLERLIREQAPSARLKRMPSRDQTVADLYRQTLVTIDLENITIPELVDIMSAMEASDQGIKVQGLKVTLSRGSEDQLDAIITALAARPMN